MWRCQKGEWYLNSAIDVSFRKVQDERRAAVDIHKTSLGYKVVIIRGVVLRLTRLLVTRSIYIRSVAFLWFFIIDIWLFIKFRLIRCLHVKRATQLKTKFTIIGAILTYEIIRRRASTTHLVPLYMDRPHVHQCESEEVVMDNVVVATKFRPVDEEVTPTSDLKESHNPLRAPSCHKTTAEREVRSIARNKLRRNMLQKLQTKESNSYMVILLWWHN